MSHNGWTARFFSLGIVALLALGGGPLGAAEAVDPWEAEAFAAEPAAVIQAASRIDPSAGRYGILFLLVDSHRTFDDAGRQTVVRREIYRILDATADESWSTIEARWSPWYQERPQLRARVITADGAVHSLDPATITEAGQEGADPTLFEDDRILRAPLPATGPGAVIEAEVTIRDTAPFFQAGKVDNEPAQLWVPVRHFRLVLDAPAGLPLRHAGRLLTAAAPREELVDGRRRLTFEFRDLPGVDDIEPGLPSDVSPFSRVAFSTGASWNEIASRYSEIVDRTIQGPEATAGLDAVRRSAVKSGASRSETIDRLLARLGTDVRYTGVELGEGGLIPRTPAETLRRKFGDCKDKAVLLTALLRSLDIPAQVALLRAGEHHPDVDETLPGMGAFNHAIVYVPGTPPVWIDPTDPYARAGELPVGDQGRLALIASPATTALVRTPEATAAENREVETREIFLADLGTSRVVEVTEYRGASELDMRRLYASQKAEDLRESITSYINAAYLTRKLSKLDYSDPKDLAKPFQIRVEAAEVGRGYTDLGSAVVAVFPSALFSRLPAEITGRGEEEEDDGEESKPRQHDYDLTRPLSVETRYRVVPPAGFRPQPLPVARTRHWGPATLSEQYTAEEGGVVTATLRLEVGKRRLTPEEFEAVRAGARELSGEDAVLLQFEQVGETYLAAGQVREALNELRRLAEGTPGKALHRTRVARALLAGGMGEAAREEARRAIALEPASAIAHRTLAWILQHDEVGRRFGKGFDRAGAIAAYRKAKELDPEEWTTRAELAILLEYDENGERYSRGADLAGAITEYQGIRKDLEESAMDDNLAVALLRAERFAELKDFLAEIDATEVRTILRLSAVAALEGPDAAVREAERKISELGKRRASLESAAGNLSHVRHYPEAAALLERASRQASNAAELLARVEVLRKARRHEEVTIAMTRPGNAMKRLLTLLDSGPSDLKAVSGLFSQGLRASVQDKESEALEQFRAGFNMGRLRSGGDVPFDVALDLSLVGFHETLNGDDEAGYRVGLADSMTGSQNLKIYVVKEGEEYKITAFGGDLESLGLGALRRLDQGDLRGARQWLDWARDEVALDGDDPLASRPIATLWKKGSEAGESEIRCAAATLMEVPAEAERRLPVLLSCRDAAPEGPRRVAFEMAVAHHYGVLQRYKEQADILRRVAGAAPDSEMASSLLGAALTRLGNWDELQQLAEQRLAARPEDRRSLRDLNMVAETRGDLEAAEKLLLRIVESGKAEAIDFNNLAWLSLVRGKVDERAIENGQRAVTLTSYRSYSNLHTLASLYADLGKTAEAYQIILQALELAPRKVPPSTAWYVFGRLAEGYGLPDAARHYYQRVIAGGGESERLSTYGLAQQRLAALGPDSKPVKAKRRAGR
jgi:tetratricopeptide (TPR) repeat protein/transglutaminase-like putative cysteine protease